MANWWYVVKFIYGRFACFSPPLPHEEAEKWFLSHDMRQNLAFIGSLPNRGIKQVRVHWLLDAIKINRFVHWHSSLRVNPLPCVFLSAAESCLCENLRLGFMMVALYSTTLTWTNLLACCGETVLNQDLKLWEIQATYSWILRMQLSCNYGETSL